MAEPSWVTAVDAYDRLSILDQARGEQFVFDETLVEVSGAPGKAKYDVKETPGKDGASTTYRGYTPAQPQVTFELWKAEHDVAYQLLRQLAPRAGKVAPGKIIVVHPDLAVANLVAFRMVDLSFPKKVRPGIYAVTLSLLEYFDQPKASPKPNTKAGDIAAVPIAAALRPAVPVPPAKPSTTKAGNAP